MRFRLRVHPDLPHSSHFRSPATGSGSMRRGAVIVEMALVAPFLVMLLLGICEIGQALRVNSFLAEAARTGCAAGSLPGSSNGDVIRGVQNGLSTRKLTASAAVITIKVNGGVGSVAMAHRNDKITVTVAIPMSAAGWTGSSVFVSRSSIQSETTVMLKQG